MKNRMRILMCLAVLVTCPAPGFAQGAGAEPPRVFAHNGKTETSYDRIRDTTTVRLDPMQLYGEPLESSNYVGSDAGRFYASFTYRGRTLATPPERILITLISTSQDWKYTDFRQPTALVDGKSLKLGPLEHLPSFTVKAPANSNSEDYVSEEIAISVPYKTFLRITNGKEVRIRMGPREFKLKETHLEALREFVR